MVVRSVQFLVEFDDETLEERRKFPFDFVSVMNLRRL